MKSSMNILHITTFLQGGGGRVIRDIAAYQRKMGNKVYVITTNTEEAGYCNYEEYIDFLEHNGVNCYKIDSTFKRDIYLNLNVAKKVKELLLEEDIDVIQAHAAVPSMVSIIARSGLNKYIPIIQTMHGWGTNKKIEQEKMDITILNSVDKIIAVSKSDKELMIKKGVCANKITVIYNGVEDTDFKDTDEDVIEDIKHYRNNGFNILGVIGTVSKRKNQNLLIEAVNKISRDKKIFCAFIGEGELIKELEKKAYEYNLSDRIRFYGYRKNASSYIKYFDYFVFTSLSEGLSIAMLEGFRERVPIIASDIDTFKECIDDSFNGYLFNNNDINSLVTVIEKVLGENKNKTIVDNAYNKFNDQFRIDIMLKKYEDIIKI